MKGLPDSAALAFDSIAMPELLSVYVEVLEILKHTPIETITGRHFGGLELDFVIEPRGQSGMEVGARASAVCSHAWLLRLQ